MFSAASADRAPARRGPASAGRRSLCASASCVERLRPASTRVGAGRSRRRFEGTPCRRRPDRRGRKGRPATPPPPRDDRGEGRCRPQPSRCAGRRTGGPTGSRWQEPRCIRAAMHPAWTALPLGRTCPPGSLVAPRHAGGSPLAVRRLSPRTPIATPAPPPPPCARPRASPRGSPPGSSSPRGRRTRTAAARSAASAPAPSTVRSTSPDR